MYVQFTSVSTVFKTKNTKKENDRSSQQRCSLKRVVLKNFAKFTGKHLYQILFFNTVAGLRAGTLLKKRL